MDITKVCLLSTLLISSFIQLGLSSSCFCTKEDGVSLFEDEELTKLATVVPNNITCLIGTRLNKEDSSTVESIVQIEELSLGKCGIDSERQSSENMLADRWSNTNMPPPYFGLYDDFFERPLEDIKKRFLIDGVGGFSVWAQWSDWGQCNASSCYDPGEVVRTRLCQYVNDNKTPCVGPDKEVLECNVSCVTGVAVGWSGWMPWNECDSDNCLSLKTSRTRLCFATDTACIGKSEEQKQCTQDLCAVDGGWTEWSLWTGCTKTMSVLTRGRECTNPKPSNLGKNCAGDFWEIRKCPDGIDSERQSSENMLADRWSNTNMPPPYFGLYDDFFERPLEDIKKRFLLDGVGGFSVWAQWSGWGQCNASSCYDPGEVVRTRLCQYVNDNKTTCVGPDKEVLECNVSCVTGVAVGWSGWMPWNECDSDNCLSLKTSRTRLCFATDTACIGKSEEQKQCTQDLCAVDGGWTEWSLWTGCTKTMSVLTRGRECTNPKPSNLGKNCAGDFWEIRKCPDAIDWNAWEGWGSCRKTSSDVYIQFRNRSCAIEDRVDTENSTCHENERLSYRTCQLYGTWNSWSSWSSCSLPSNQETKIRSRSCNMTTAVNQTCIGNGTEEVNCTDSHVILPTEWSKWSDCYQPCNGRSHRNRTCTANDAEDCVGVEEHRQCSEDICIVNGNWSEWSEWFNCTTIDKHQVRTRNRTCDDPPPRNGGTPCFEASTEVGLCNKDAEWGNWQSWQQCIPIDNLNGVRFRYKTCHHGTNNSSTCPGIDFDREACKLHGSWNAWEAWSPCSVTCENGVFSRTRTCEKKDDMKDCIGNSTDTKLCTASPHCPVNGGYTTWSEWSPCPVTCGPGAVFRTRYCTNPTPAFGGQNCSHLGETVEASFCNVDCPTDGHWGSWLPWGACSASCNHGVKVRERKCDNPPASNGGLPCEGVATSTENCSLPLCSVDGKWSQWSEWSQCSCDHYHVRHRDCNNPTPVGAGLYCPGNATEKETCEPNPLLACPINGGWGEWFEWSTKCSVTCAQGVTKRIRQCSNPVPANGGVYCKGALFEEKPCVEAPCPIDGVFATWSTWGICSVTCDNGTQVRNRTCDPPPMYGGANCTGDYQEHKTCVQNQCPIDGGWSDWGSWSNWDKTCSFATRIRSRDCDNPAPQYHGRICIGEFNHTESTDLGHCPVDGNWGSWESWSECSVTCLEGTHSRVRKCDSPSPAYNGSDCVGNETEVATCIEKPTCVVDGKWAEWTEWFGCSTTCGPGENLRYRTCTNPTPQNGGKTCPGAFSNSQNCNVIECPVDGSWTAWSAWSACSVTCEDGTQYRSRSCTAPSPDFGGSDCQGLSNEIQPCTKSPCPIDGNWSDWGTWSNCAATCGNTTKSRVRECNNPKPNYNGSLCIGNSTDEIACEFTHCPIDGKFGDWQAWDKCSVSCSDGTKLRHRLCDNPPPQHGGKNCTGTYEENSACNEGHCPINGGWGPWTPWSRCQGNCTSAMHKRVRNCDSPKPDFSGLYCVGEPLEKQPCTPSTCQPLLNITTTVQATTIMSTMPPTTPSTAAPTNFRCYTCDGPIPEFCITMMKETTCPEPYCINELTNSNNGDKLLNRRCGTKHECDKEWWTSTSDNDKCMLYDDTQTVTNYIHCTFCCTDELCNKPTVPTADSLYKPQIN